MALYLCVFGFNTLASMIDESVAMRCTIDTKRFLVEKWWIVWWFVGKCSWFTFLGILMLVGGVLEIILFFKIWVMTNDVGLKVIDLSDKEMILSKGDIPLIFKRRY